MPLLNFDFVMIPVIHKMLVLLKNNLNCLKDSILESLSLEEENLIKDIINLFRPKKN